MSSQLLCQPIGIFGGDVECTPAHDEAWDDEQDIALPRRGVCGPFRLPFEPRLRANYVSFSRFSRALSTDYRLGPGPHWDWRIYYQPQS